MVSRFWLFLFSFWPFLAQAQDVVPHHLSWQDNADNEERFEVERRADDGSFFLLATLPINTQVYQDTELVPGRLYTYRVRAWNAVGYSGYSNEASRLAQVGQLPNAPGIPVKAWVEPPSSLVAHYRFNETNGTTASDSSGNNNHGTLANGATWAVGKNGSAVSLDGTNDKVALPSTLDIASLPFTLEAWIRPTSFASWGAIFSKRASYSASQMRVDVGLEISSGNVYVTTHNSFVTSTYAPPLNVWTHVALVAESNSTKLYVNGSLQQTLGAVTLGSGTTAPVAIGTTGDGDDPFRGQIDDLRLYIRALSQTEIQIDMNTAL